jgi:hypothetical protein
MSGRGWKYLLAEHNSNEHLQGIQVNLAYRHEATQMPSLYPPKSILGITAPLTGDTSTFGIEHQTTLEDKNCSIRLHRLQLTSYLSFGILLVSRDTC